jgi:O-antigen/teichoic acid export membrane protein
MSGIIRKGLRLLRLDAFDTAEAGGRSKERYRRVAFTTLASIGSRGIQILTSLITVPLTLNYLGAERYGMWMTMSSLVAMLGFADLGIGNGLLNAVSDAFGRRDSKDAARYVSSAFFTLIGIAAVVGIAFAAAYRFVPWARVFNVASPTAASEAGPAVAVLVACFLVGLPLGITSRVRFGYQQGFVDSSWMAGGSLVSLIAVLLAVALRAGLPVLVLAMSAGPLVATLFNGSWLFFKTHPELRPHWSRASRVAAFSILSTGVYFFILQIASAVAYQSDGIVVAQILGPESVAQYAVPMKLFILVPTILGFVFMPLWPAYAEAFARGDRDWALVTLRRSLKLAAAVSIPISLLLVVVGGPLIQVWVGPSIDPPWLLLAAAGTWAVMSAFAGALAMFLNGAKILRFQAVTAICMMVGNLGLSILFTLWIGLSGVLWGSVVAQAVFVFLPTVVFLLWFWRPPGTHVEMERVADP